MRMPEKVAAFFGFGWIVGDEFPAHSATNEWIGYHEIAVRECYQNAGKLDYGSLSVELESIGWVGTMMLALGLFIVLVVSHHWIVMLARIIRGIVSDMNPNSIYETNPGGAGQGIPVPRAVLLCPQDVLSEQGFAEVTHVFHETPFFDDDHDEEEDEAIPLVYAATITSSCSQT